MVLVIMALGLVLIWEKPFLIDEPDHLRVIGGIARLEWGGETFARTAVFPGYHFVLGFLSRALGGVSLPLARLLSTIFSFASVLVFYLTAKEIEPQGAEIKTFQYFFLPILFVFFFLVYTEVFSLLLLMLCFLFLLRGKYKTAGFFGFLSVLTRQNNIFWLGFLVFLMAKERFKGGWGRERREKFLKEASVFIFTFLALGAFVFWNKGLVLTDAGAHPLGVYFGNIFVSLLFYFFLFLPLNLANFPQMMRESSKMMKKKPGAVVWAGLVFAFYIFAFKADHPYNQARLGFFLRNRLLAVVMRGDLVKALFFIPIGYSILSLAVTEFWKRDYYFLYLFAGVVLGLSWLVEPRYYLTPLVFFLLLRKKKSVLVERLTVAFFIILTGWIFWGTLNQRFFW